jgi:LPS sulfotransferase NodH
MNLTPEEEDGVTSTLLFILAEPRSGSSWLLQTLNSHEEINLGLEFFNHASYNEVHGFRKIETEKFGICFDYLEKKIDGLKKARFNGCKILLNQLEMIADDFPEQYIEKYRDAYYIFLTRKNELEMQTSLRLAHEYKKWHTRNDEGIQKRKIKINPKQLVANLGRFQKVRKKYEEILTRINVKQMHLDYETLFADNRRSLQRICDFIGLEAKSDAFRLSDEIKGNPFTLEQVIENFDEIVAELEDYPQYKDML